MIGFLNGWFFVTIIAPLALPVIGIVILRLFPISGPPLAVISTVKDGQWGWAIIAMGASAIYELWEAEAGHKSVPDWAGWAFGGLILVMLSAMLVAAVGSAFTTPLLPVAAGGLRAWAAHYKVFVFSAFLTAGTAVLYTAVHFSISP